MASSACAPATLLDLLFVDFDGVLHPYGKHPLAGPGAQSLVHELGLFCWLEHLEELLLPRPQVGLVVHSSWRYPHKDDELADMLGRLSGRFVGSTPRGARYGSITRWLSAREPKVRSYRILDDMPEAFPKSAQRRLIACKPWLGVSELQVQGQLRAWLESLPQG